MILMIFSCSKREDGFAQVKYKNSQHMYYMVRTTDEMKSFDCWYYSGDSVCTLDTILIDYRGLIKEYVVTKIDSKIHVTEEK